MERQSPSDGEIETKIQVDRRRLEAMITGELPGEDTATFFARVEKSTGARICWPSRLKIRAKTKKDPFVKLIGTSQNVQKATEMIEEQLRIKRERMTLKIEVSHSMHSQIIGRGGRNTQQIMRDTNCHIHFPDSNKSAATTTSVAKNDQVSISGCAKDVDRAREMIRAICPLTVSVAIRLGAGRNLHSIQPRLDPALLQHHFPPISGSDLSVQFISQGPPLLGSLHFLMRSRARSELDILRAFGKVCQLIGVFPSGAELVCSSQFELRSAALPSIGAIRWIVFRTNTQIQLNDRGLLISGSLEGIFIARKLLTGLLPVSLHFENPSDSTGNPLFNPLETDLDVQISERRRRKSSKLGTTTSAKNDEKDFVINTYEANLFGAYTARNRLLNIGEASSKDHFPKESESAAFMRSMCRESLLSDQQQPLAAAASSVSFANSAAFEQTGMMGRSWRTTNGEKKSPELELAKSVEEAPKSPDPQESPIAAGLLAGAKSVNSQKGEFKKMMDREQMLLKANRAIYNSPIIELGHENSDKQRTPTDLWAGYGFSSSLPVDLLRLGRTFGGEGTGMATKGLFEMERRGRPIVGMGAEDDQEEEGEEWRKDEKNKADDEKDDDERGSRETKNSTKSPKAPFVHPIISRQSSCSSSSSALPSSSSSSHHQHLFARSNPSKSPFTVSPSILRNSLGGIQLVALHEEKEEPNPNGSDQNRGVEQRATTKARNDGIQQVRQPAAKIHPRIAALQIGEQRRPKFTMSTGLFDTFRTSQPAPAPTTSSANGPFSPANNSKGKEWEAPAGTGPGPIWDIRVMGEPAMVLAQLGLAEHIPFFREQEIDMQAFLLLDEQCLKSLGVTTLGARRKIMHAIMKLRDSAQRHGMYSL